jgi:hypothetical protein
MSAIPPKADVADRDRHVRFVRKNGHSALRQRLLFDHLVGERKQRRRNFEATCLRSLEIDDQVEFIRGLDREV